MIDRPLEAGLLGLAAIAGGAINALAGGGTLITFPALIAAGLPPLAANVTNTVAMAPGYLGASIAQRADLAAERPWLARALPAALAGGAVGAALLLLTGERAFAAATPYLILFAAGLLAAQEPIRRWLARRRTGEPVPGAAVGAVASVAAIAGSAVYSGYFGAGASVILLAVLGLALDRPLPRLNGLKQALALAANAAAVAVVAGSGRVAWGIALLMAVAALVGGAIGARLAGRLRPAALRFAVVGVGVAVGLIYLMHGA
ncbi:MAG TPA: sulfite exporter TauE/SafE family protein [Dongiaceae bacterium]|nr:sulfite exporter TauE/SafE family protein [Dongiaceae bacterium]